MDPDLNLLSLPDLVLYHICSFVTCPFSLLNLGATCTKLHKITSTQSLWWNLAVQSLHGIWYCFDNLPQDEQARDWFLKILRNATAESARTKTICQFDGGETWTRIDSRIFRCYLGLLQVAYVEKHKESHPMVLYERWLYDIGLYRRENSSKDFTKRPSLTRETVLELSTLSQAKDRDLRSRKQPYIDPNYYIKIVKSSSHINWVNDLFPCGPFGSKYPLLICPFQDAPNSELTGVSGLLICMTCIVEKHVIKYNRHGMTSIIDTANSIRSAVRSFGVLILAHLREIQSRWGRYALRSAVESIALDGFLDLKPFQESLSELGSKFEARSLVKDLHMLLQTSGGIDSIVNSIRSRWRKCLFPEIERTLSVGNYGSENVTRMNLTDSDLIGGDNHRQEMSAAAFITQSGVLVTWHLIGRLRF